MPAVDKIFYHHPKMALGAAKSSNAVKKYGLKKPDMAVNRQLIYV